MGKRIKTSARTAVFIILAAVLFYGAGLTAVSAAAKARHLPYPDEAETPHETINLRFYYHCHEADPDFKLHPEAYRYKTVEVPAQHLWAEFPRLMYEHTGINISNLWRAGNKLYVDLHPEELAQFDQGSTASADRGERLIRTIAGLPEITSFEILIAGKRGVETSHISFAWIAVVENGEITSLIPNK